MRSISVVIPNYNGKHLFEKYFEQNLEILSKLNTNVQIIVIDDASTDDSVAYLKENYGTDASLDSKTALVAGIRERKYRFRDFRRKIIPTAKNIVKSIIRR